MRGRKMLKKCEISGKPLTHQGALESKRRGNSPRAIDKSIHLPGRLYEMVENGKEIAHVLSLQTTITGLALGCKIVISC